MLSYDLFTEAFLNKITEYDFLDMGSFERASITNGYLRRAVAEFRKNNKYVFSGKFDDAVREIDVDVDEEDVDELVNIISEGMVIQWMKPYLYKQELLESALNTRDFTGYSPAELLYRVRETYAQLEKEFRQMVREYSYNHSSLRELHS